MTLRRNFSSAAVRQRPTRQFGVSLIETMVGLTLGLLVTLVITQVWGAFEGQKQRTISGASAHVTGLLAMTELEQDLRSAGAGLADSAAFNCVNTYSYYEAGGTSVSPVPAYAGGMAPVRITDGGTGSDTVVVKRSADVLGALPATITQAMPSSSAELNLGWTTGFAAGDIVLAIDASAGNCTVMLLTQVQPAAFKLQHNPGGTVTYNPTNAFQTDNGWPAYPAGSTIEKVGALIAHSYTVNAANQLTLTDTSLPQTVTTSELGADIVGLKAQYGVANAGSQDVNAWVSATAASGWNVLDAAKIRRIKAVRIAVVARSPKREGADVSMACKDASGAVVNANGPCVWPDSEPVVNLGANPDWKKYRYRIYQTIIPLRNVIWAGA